MDAALQADVKLLADLLNEILRTQQDPRLPALLEEVVSYATRARSGSAEDAEALRGLLASLDADQALPLCRAFAHFLALANIAEQHNRVRTYRARQAEPGSVSASMRELRSFVERGVPASQVLEAISNLRVELVLTAHPTQTLRRTLLQKHRRIAAALARGESADLLPAEREETLESLRREITALWETDELRRKRPTPVEEARAGLVLFDQILWDAVAGYLRRFDQAMREVTGSGLPLEVAPLRFGSWMGGDRDGNPNVTAKVTEQVCLLSRWEAAELYYHELELLHDELSLSRCSPQLQERAGDTAEPYRAVIKEAMTRLGATQRFCEAELIKARGDAPSDGRQLISSERPQRVVLEAKPYDRVSELFDALSLCYYSLIQVGAHSVADGRLLDVLRRVSVFGLSLTRLDIRQESSVHARAIDAITQALDLGSYLEWPEAQRIEFLVRELKSKRPLLPRELPDDPLLTEVLATLAVCAKGPAECFGAYVISMATRASDVLAVYLLQREAGVKPYLRVVPLFETLADLENAGAVLESLLEIPAYRELIRGEQEVMIGYSDSTKDAGRVASAWSLFTAQEDVVTACRAHDIKLTLFHGRGGTIGRGGGPIYLAILSQPPGSVDSRLRVTIQGETMETLFGLPDVAVESFELYVNATLEATLQPPAAPTPDQRTLMQRLGRLSTGAYRRVVQGPDFMRYFTLATPIGELGRLNIGSRPARRNNGTVDLGSLRAIPWIFAWTQTRLHLPAWLGAGEALMVLFEEGAESQLRALARDWPFFRSLLDLLEMVLAKADPDIAAYYDRVLVSDDLRPLGQELRASCRSTIASILRAKAQTELLGGDPELQRTIELRNPYVDPLNVLQAELLRRARATDDPRLWDALLVTVNGIAAGMRNTG
ncbi:MAG TPA: phosphoenolpyruvate carboxylase [Polyangiales bacterium]|nr:phosphoenolpyruvate carboxylase [Polyangiales bacterium]